MALVWPNMTPDEVAAREIPWIGQLNGDYIDSSALTIVQGDVTLSSISHDNDFVRCELSGAGAGFIILKNIIETGDGRTLEQIISFQSVIPTVCMTPTMPSTASKKTIVDMACEMAGLSGYTFDRTPEETASFVRVLDGLMAEWQAQSIRLGYNFPSVFGTSDPDEASGIPDFSVASASTALAMRIAPGLGKTMSADARAAYNAGMIAVRAATARIPDRQFDRKTPRGDGQKPWAIWQPFIYPDEPNC